MIYDVAITGGGIVGLATAYKLLEKTPGLKICLIEKEKTIAKHQTGNNSGVIHSGIYYKPGSLKAKNCLKGYDLMIDYCNQKSITYDLCAKLIVAKDESEIPNMNVLYQRGIDKGMKGLEIVDQKGITEVEPHIKGVKAIYVPQAGIIDYKEVAQKIREDLEAKGCHFVFSERVSDFDISKDVKVKTTKATYDARFLINCAGLYSDVIAKKSGFEVDYKIIPFRGEYYILDEESSKLVNGLIYPVPNPDLPFLGVHLTKKLDGIVEAGPNAVLAFKREGYKFTDIKLSELSETLRYSGFRKLVAKYSSIGFSEFRRSLSKRKFLNDVREFLPQLGMSNIKYRGAGVRAQACDKSGNLLDDFLILEKDNVVNVCNSPSPAATSCFAIGETIASYYFNNN